MKYTHDYYTTILKILSVNISVEFSSVHSQSSSDTTTEEDV